MNSKSGRSTPRMTAILALACMHGHMSSQAHERITSMGSERIKAGQVGTSSRMDAWHGELMPGRT